MKINRRKFSAALLPALMGGAPASFAQAVRPGGGEILIGQTLPLTGPVGQLGADFHSGFQAALAQANQRGGIGGRLVKLMTLDDGYVVARTLANAEKLVKEHGVLLLSGCVGTANVLALMPALAQEQVPLFAPYTGADAVQKEAGRNVFTVMASYGQETEKMVQHLSTIGMRRIAVAYQNNGFGKVGLEGVQAALQRRNATPADAAALEPDGNSLEKVAEQLARRSPQAVIVAAVGRSLLDFIRAFRRAGAKTQFMLLAGSTDAATLGRELGDDAVGIVMTQTAPSPVAANLKVAAEHRQAMQAADAARPLNYTTMTGHIAASALVQVLKRAGRDATRERFIAAAEAFDRMDLGGFELRFSKERHHGSSLVDISMVRRTASGWGYAS